MATIVIVMVLVVVVMWTSVGSALEYVAPVGRSPAVRLIGRAPTDESTRSQASIPMWGTNESG